METNIKLDITSSDNSGWQLDAETGIYHGSLKYNQINSDNGQNYQITCYSIAKIEDSKITSDNFIYSELEILQSFKSSGFNGNINIDAHRLLDIDIYKLLTMLKYQYDYIMEYDDNQNQLRNPDYPSNFTIKLKLPLFKRVVTYYFNDVVEAYGYFKSDRIPLKHLAASVIEDLKQFGKEYKY